MIAHITIDELQRHLSDTERHNGFANRLLWCCSRRSRCLPEGGLVPAGELNELASEMARIVEWSKIPRTIQRDSEARRHWHDVYRELSEGHPGLLGAATSRAEAYTMRLSMLYAAIDCSSEVRTEHLRAALAVWNYCFASARFIFGGVSGDPVADRIREKLKKAGPEGLTRTQIRDLLGRNASAERINPRAHPAQGTWSS